MARLLGRVTWVHKKTERANPPREISAEELESLSSVCVTSLHPRTSASEAPAERA
jgi:hypothetical protein